jgi:hypothetical protein
MLADSTRILGQPIPMLHWVRMTGWAKLFLPLSHQSHEEM